MPAVATITDQWSDGKRLHVTGILTLSGSYAVGGDAIDFGDAGVRSSRPPLWLDMRNAGQYEFHYAAGNLVGNGLLVVLQNAPRAASGTITSSGVNVADGDTATLGATTYTFKTALTPSANQVLIGATAAASMLNLVNAMNNNPEFVAVSYGTVTPNASAYAALDSTGLIITMVARKGGTAGNSVGLSKVAASLSVSAANLANGAADATDTGQLVAGAYPVELLVITPRFYGIWEQFI